MGSEHVDRIDFPKGCSLSGDAEDEVSDENLWRSQSNKMSSPSIEASVASIHPDRI